MWVSPRRRAGRRRGFPLCPETFSLRCVPQEVWSREQAGMNDAFLANAGSYAIRYLVCIRPSRKRRHKRSVDEDASV